MHVRHAADRRPSKVQSHRHAVFLGHISDFVSFQDASSGGEVRLNLAYRVLLTQHLKRFLQINIFASENGGGALFRNLLEQVGIIPGNDIFDPRQVVFFIGLAQSDDGLHAKMPEVVHGKGNFHSDGVAHGGDILLEHGYAFVGDFHSEQRMRQLIRFPLI